MARCTWLLSSCVALALAPAGGQAQEAEAAVLNLFFDCQAPGCRDLDFLRREAPFVNWVRDREDADVHVLVTSQPTGGGGRQYTLDFIGIADLEGEDQQLTHATAGDATTDEQRNGVAEKLKLGLVRYVADTPAADRLQISYEDVAGGPDGPGGPTASAQEDSWDFWTFRLNADGFINGEATSRLSNTSGRFEADRTTEMWKVNIEGSFSQFVQKFEIPDTTAPGGFRSVKETREDWNASGTLVRSLGEQWALGIRTDAGSSTFLNQDFRWSAKPGIEYNFVPYSESSRRLVTVQYLVGPNHFDYTDPTIFDQTSETRLQQSLTGRISLIQPWGRWSTSLTAAQYLHDTSKYNVTLGGNVNVRLFRGFSVRFGGNYSWIRDQLFLRAGGATDEEVLLRQRQLETSYRYFTNFGIEYRFGSIFNNVVNPRFGGGGGGGNFFFF